MVQIKPCRRANIAETCCASISIKDLKELSEDKSWNPVDFSTKLTYGSIRGSEKLRQTLANLYFVRTPTALPADNVLITAGAIQANFLLLYTLIGPGDHAICHYPTYQRLYSVPESVGAKVSLWKAKANDGWKLDMSQLKTPIKPNTKLIILNCIHSLLKHKTELAKKNLGILEQFIESHRWACDWFKPRAGTTAFRTGDMFVPGSLCFGDGEDFVGYVGIGFVCETEALEKGMAALKEFMEDSYDEVPVVKKK
ncbi:uncharacterized protein CDV56_106304 [Aspergillus thermomutatus]|uniref:Aminotransferase class I/classII large domain-containing protein n=1 Tax=Aspergillus thermomutatus TaxID=41047 RepID=A0A397GKF8_ASPTH|nr:uncharacterized protein CDV56_106304 [Aspergillus thermomutatus]RHZ51482.1 hypothetical protein CDV56_106304 [Aspergillus thermomutatus]